MRWSERSYNEGTALQIINQLDLSSGDDLLDKCNAVCSWYDEVILNRKYFIKQLIEQQLAASEHENQLVFLAAGKSPLAAELLSKYSSRIDLVCEIDISGMNEKKKLYDNIYLKFKRFL
ncbi:MAG TPA: hypothetical protein VJJ51_14910 [Candidatus Methanoperedens sp.]|nr:hypothetical protein [Candidatus Methanoperedens sp.]HLB72332.1 hypothetical protein [Candidatus Methanoperedens sp.]